MNLRQEGKQLLDSTGLKAILECFGEVSIGGSYAYDLLVDRDIDIDVRLPKNTDLTFDVRAEFAATLLREVRAMRGIKMADLHHFPAGAKHQIDGIWYGLNVISEQSGERWNIDIWLLLAGSRTEEDTALTERLMNLTTNERETIMRLKQEALRRSMKEKGATSVQIYRAVLERGATSLDEIMQS